MWGDGTTAVIVGGEHAAWFDDEYGTFYTGWPRDLTHPLGEVSNDGHVVANDARRSRIGWVDSYGSVRSGTPHDATVVGAVTPDGSLRDPSDREIARCDGARAVDAGAGYLLLVHLRPQRHSWVADAVLMVSGLDSPITPGPPPESPFDSSVRESSDSGAGDAPRAPDRPRAPTAEESWEPGQPYPASLVPDPDGPGPRRLGLGRKRSGGFSVGDQVWVSDFGNTFWGHLLDISTEFANARGFGTRLYPAFLVERDSDGSRAWFNGINLHKAGPATEPPPPG